MSEVSTRGGGPDARSAAEIEADIARTRHRLASTLDEIAVRVHPSTIAGQAKARAVDTVDRTVGRAYAAANAGVERVRSQFVDEKGSPRPDRIAAAAGVVVLAVGGCVVLRRRRRCGR